MANGTVLRMNPEELYSCASAVDDNTSTLADILESLDKSMNNIFNNSEGEAIESIHERYNAIYSQYERFLQLMESYAKTIRTVADNMAAADADIAKQILG